MKRLIFAFPGMGKTPTCKAIPNCMDLDFGMFRSALQVEKKNEVELFPAFIRLIVGYLDEYWNVFTNEPKLLESTMLYNYVKPRDIIMYLPAGKGLAYCARKMNVTVEQLTEWVSDWNMIANKAGIRVVELTVGLDVYLSGLN